MDAGEPTPSEAADLVSYSLLEKLNGLEEFQYFKAALEETLVDAYLSLASASNEPAAWRAQGEVNIARKLLELLEEAPLEKAKLLRLLRKRSQDQAAADMASFDLEAQQAVEQYRRSKSRRFQ